MTKDNHIPSGYKPSPLGIIPEDWEVKRLGEVCTFLDSQRIPIKDADRGKMQGKYPYYGASGIIDYVNDYIFDDDLILLGEDGANIITRSTPLAFLVSGKVWINNHAHVLKTNEGYNRSYICNYLESLSYDKFNTGTAQPKLNQEVCEHIPMLIPSEDEQNKISDLLTLWDTAITKQTALIEKLTLRKRGLMQQLLTGKKRLKGFEGNSFKMMSFDKIADTVNVKTFQVSKSDYQEKGKTPIVDQGQMFIAAYSDSNKVFSEVPFILFGDHTRIIKWIDFPCVIGADGVQAIKSKKNMDIKYLYYLLSNTELPNLGYSRHMSILKEKVFFVATDINEQKAIAQCLSNADKEIELQKQKLTNLQEQKKGLMQILLTGKRRVTI